MIHLNFLKASSLRLALNSATAAVFASLAFSIFVSAYHLCTGSALTQLFNHSAHSTSIQSEEEGSPERQFLAESNFTLNDCKFDEFDLVTLNEVLWLT